MNRVTHPSPEKKEQEALQKIFDRMVDEDLKAMLGMPFGQRFFLRLIGVLGYFQSPYNKNNQIMLKNIGKLEIAQVLVADAERLLGKDFYDILISEKEELKKREKKGE